MSLRLFLTWLACALLALPAGCLPASRELRSEPLEPVAPLEFELVPGRTRIERFDPPGAGSSVELTVTAQVRNPNAFGVRLARVAYEVYLAGKSVGQGEVAPASFIAAGAEAPVRFAMVASLEGDAALVRAVAQAFTGTPLPLRIEGIEVFASESHEFSSARRTLLTGEVAARQLIAPPRLRLDEGASSVFLLRPELPVVRVVVTASNPGPIGYFLYGQELALELGGEVVARQDMPPVPVPAGQASRFELLFYPQPAQLSGRARALLDAALQGIPTALELRGDFAVDVLGVDSYPVPETRLTGFVYSVTP